MCTELDIKRAVARGRWYVRNEMVGVIQLKKYRVMRRRYGYIEEDDRRAKRAQEALAPVTPSK